MAAIQNGPNEVADISFRRRTIAALIEKKFRTAETRFLRPREKSHDLLTSTERIIPQGPRCLLQSPYRVVRFGKLPAQLLADLCRRKAAPDLRGYAAKFRARNKDISLQRVRDLMTHLYSKCPFVFQS
ncbi:hypothetical protein Trydic_g19615 [Trypoxylus dichotomus]